MLNNCNFILKKVGGSFRTFLVLDFGLDIVDCVARFDLERNSFSGQGFHEDLHFLPIVQPSIIKWLFVNYVALRARVFEWVGLRVARLFILYWAFNNIIGPRFGLLTFYMLSTIHLTQCFLQEDNVFLFYVKFYIYY